MKTRSMFMTLALAVGLTVAGATAALAQHEGHNHGAAAGPEASLEDIAARASTVGERFQFVALPKDGRLVIFLDHTGSNAPAPGARIEILAGDAEVVAEETAPGLYIVAPWPAEGMSAEEAESAELVATVVSGDLSEVLLARMSGVEDHSGHDHEGHNHGAAPAKSEAQRVALWDGVKPLMLPVAAGFVALLGAIAAVRSSGRRRWLGVAVSGVSLVTLIAATSLV